MKEQFVPYEIALKLQEKGFDEECLAYWVDKDTLRSCGAILFEVDGFFRNSLSPEKYLIATPLWQQVIDWFGKRGIYITIRHHCPDVEAYFDFYVGENYVDKIFNTRPEAMKAAIEHALTLI